MSLPSRPRTAGLGLAVFFSGLIAPGLAPAVHAQATLQVVMSGLNNPHGLAVGPDGGLYVAEAGSGGTGAGFLSSSGDAVTYGATGAVSRYLNGTQQQIMSGLASVAPAGGASATGLQDLAFDSSGHLFGLFGLGGTAAQRATLIPTRANAADLGQLVSLDTTTGAVIPVADLAGYETTNNPDQGATDSNPYGLTALAGGGFAVADAGGNDVLGVTAGGTVTTLGVFPNTPNPLFPALGGPTYQAVPTATALGPDGALYVSQLTGFPFISGAADVFRIDPVTGKATVAFTGFTNITDLTFGKNGDLYVLEISAGGLAAPTGPVPGALIQVDPFGTRTTLASAGLVFPTSIVQGADGALYVSDMGTSPGGGEVVRIVPPVPEASSSALLGLGLLVLTGLVARKKITRRA